MQTALLQWLASVGWTAFSWALAGLLLFNAAAVWYFLLNRHRGTVERLTPWWLGGNLLLIVIGVGVPTITAVARLTLFVMGGLIPSAASFGG